MYLLSSGQQLEDHWKHGLLVAYYLCQTCLVNKAAVSDHEMLIVIVGVGG